jgi:threonine dehydrogenase-like Zn-dependent dehydrogenase
VGNVALVYEATGASALAFRALQVLGPNGIFIFTGVPGLGAANHIETDAIMRNLVLRNQIILGTVNAGKEAFAAAVRELDAMHQRWPATVGALISGRHPLDAARDLLLGQMGGIKHVLSFDVTTQNTKMAATTQEQAQ